MGPGESETITKVLLADDHPVVRLGLRTLLTAEAGLELVGEATSGLEVLPLVERLQPDVLVLDLMMPELSGLEILRQLAQYPRRPRVLVLSMHGAEAYVGEALRTGAAGYVLKGSDAVELVHAIREIAAGRQYLSPALSERGIDSYLRETQAQTPDAYDTLTRREREILCLAAQGHTSGDIARQLYISTRTVETHRSNFMRKLNLRSQTELVRYAIRRGIIFQE